MMGIRSEKKNSTNTDATKSTLYRIFEALEKNKHSIDEKRQEAMRNGSIVKLDDNELEKIMGFTPFNGYVKRNKTSSRPVEIKKEPSKKIS
ncbi:MAG: hypothetical protein K6A23_13305 [Butyrivibrio sp.]|nr:hypothetical protein [Butyrivibrio sp.]